MDKKILNNIRDLVVAQVHKRKIPADDADVDDMVQDVALRVCERGSESDLGLVVNGVVVDWVRKEARHYDAECGLVDEQDLSATDDASEYGLIDPLAEDMPDLPLFQIMEAIEELPGEVGEVARLVFVEEYTHADVAEHLGVSRQRVTQLIGEARSMLRVALYKRGQDDE